MKSVLKILVVAIVTSFWPLYVVAELQTVEWADLIDPQAQTFVDPYRNLTGDQIAKLRMIFESREKLENGTILGEEKSTLAKRVANAEVAFAEAGIDVNWLISQRWVVAGKREQAANAGNPVFDNQQVSIAGFAIPAPREADGTSAVYLVELPGMCSHTPPPPPNQLIKVRLPSGWSPRYMHQPVRVKGQLQNDPSQQIFRVVDGDVTMKATWQLDAIEIEDFRSSRKATGAISDWVNNMRARFDANQSAPDRDTDMAPERMR